MAIRPPEGSFYDFKCGNDFKRVKLNIKSNTFHAVKVQAEIAQTIHFQEGLARIDEILFYKCFKMTRVIWPEDCGFINILKVYMADSLRFLDISPLQQLEQFSVRDCSELERVSGFGKKIKSILIFGGKIKSLDLSNLNHLEDIIIVTSAPEFNLNVDHCDALKFVSITTAKGHEDNVIRH